jgi:sporulation protein YlmC with PRC-barrel domain
MRRLLLLVLATAFALPAVAQTAAHPRQIGFLTGMPDGAIRISGIRGTEVIGSDIRRLGTIEDVVLDRSGAVTAVVIGTGGLLGVGEKKVAVPYASLLWNYDATPTAGPSSSTTGGAALPGKQEFQTRSAVGTATGTVGDPAKPAEGLRPDHATVPVTAGGEPRRAVLRMTMEEMRNAPEFKSER